MLDPSDLIDDALRYRLAGDLKSLGYRKSGRTFYCVADDCTQVVNVQANRSNTVGNARFTVNIGVYFPALTTVSEMLQPKGKFPKEYDCNVRKRLGTLLTGDDYWWTLEGEHDVEPVGASVFTAWNQVGRSWAEKMSSLENVRQELIDQKNYFLVAAISVLHGDSDTAAEYIGLAHSQQPMAARKIRDWATRHSLPLTTDCG